MAGVNLTPVDNDPFAASVAPTGVNLTPVDNDPFAPSSAPGILANSSDDGWGSGFLKGAGTAIIKGLGDIPGGAGNLRQSARGLSDYLFSNAESYLTGKPRADVLADFQKREALSGPQLGDKLPTGATFSDPVLAKTGQYEPTSIYGRTGQAGLEAATSMIGGGPLAKAAPGATFTQAALKTPLKMAPGAFASGASGSAVTELTGDPVYGTLASLAVPMAGGKAFDAISRPVKDYVAPMRKANQQGLADQQLLSVASNPEKAVADAQFQPGNIVPGAPSSTLGTVTGDTGILQAEKANSISNGEFDASVRNLNGKQNTAARDTLNAVEPATSDPMAAPNMFRQKLADLDTATAHATDRIAQAAETANAGIPIGVEPTVSGDNLRKALASAEDASALERSRLYNLVNPDKKMSVVTSGTRDTGASIRNSIDPSVTIPSPLASPVLDMAANLTDVTPLHKLTALDQTVTSKMSEAKRSGDNVGYGQLTRLKTAVMSDINNAVENQHAWEQAAVERGAIAPTDTIAARLAGERNAESANLGNSGGNLGTNGQSAAVGRGAGTPATDAGDLGGERAGSGGLSNAASSSGLPGSVASDTVYYPGGRLNARPEIAELGDLVASHGTDFRENPAYPQQLQPRNRSSAPAQDQVNSMAARLQPDRLGPSPEANSGAPIVGPDNVVESGNGRTLAIAKAYEQGNTTYPAWLKSQGHDISGFKQPVLIQRRTSAMTPAEREYFAHSANSASGLRMSAAEQAASDAKSITPDMVGRIKSGDMGAAENRDFVRGFMDKIPATERGGMMDRDGNLSQAGVKRLEAAVAAHAYGDTGFISRAFDTTDPGIKNVTGALTDAAGAWSKMRELARSGDIDPAHDVTPEVMRAVKTIMKARDEGRPVSELLNQSDMFRSPVAKSVEDIIFKDGKVASKEQIATGLKSYAEEAAKNEAGPRLFGESLSPADILKSSVDKSNKEPVSPSSEPATGSTFAKGAQEPVTTGPRPNVNAEDATRLAAAKEAHKDFAKYQEGVVGNILKDNGFKGQYTTDSGAIPSTAFPAGDRGYDVVSEVLKRAKNDPQAVGALKDIATSRLRDEMKGNDLLTQKNLDNWKRKYSTSLKALDEASPGFSSRFDTPAAATEILGKAQAARADALANAQKGVAGKFLGLTDPDEVKGVAGQMLSNKTKGPTQIAEFMRNSSSNPDAIAGLRRAGVEYMLDRFSNAGVVDGEHILSLAGLPKFVRENESSLTALFGSSGMANIRRLAASAERDQASISAVQAKAGSDTGKNIYSILKEVAQNTKGEHSIGTGTWLAFLEAFREFGWEGATGVAGAHLARTTLGKMRANGINNVNDLYLKGLIDPKVGAEMMSRALDKNGNVNAMAINRLTAAVARSSQVNTAIQNEQKHIQRASGGRVEKRDYPAKKSSNSEKPSKHAMLDHLVLPEPKRTRDQEISEALRLASATRKK